MKIKLQKLAVSTIIFAAFLPLMAQAGSMVVSTVKKANTYDNNLSWFRYFEYPGTTIKDAIILRNIGTEEETVKLYATDAIANQAGSFTPKLENDEQKGLGEWTKLAVPEITLAPEETKEVSFEIAIPKDIAPGQYFGSIINEQVLNNICPTDSNGNATACSNDIQIRTRTGNRVYLTIPGEAKKDITLTNLTWKLSGQQKVLFTFNLSNNGNVAFAPEATLHIYNSWGKEIDTVTASLGKSLPMSSTSPIIEWNRQNNFGQFTVKADIYYREDDQGRFDSLHGTVLSDNTEIAIYIIPWTSLLIALLLALATLGGLFGRNKYYQYLTNNAFEHVTQDNETIITLAEHYHVKWQTLAKINHLTAPYVLNKNQIIKIPSSHQQTHEQ